MENPDMLNEINRAASCAVVPCLDENFIPAILWDREFRKAAAASGRSKKIVIALERSAESISTFSTGCSVLRPRRNRKPTFAMWNVWSRDCSGCAEATR